MNGLLPDIDSNLTKRAVENALEKYRLFLIQQPIDRLPRITATYSLIVSSKSNAFHSSTEEIAIKNANLGLVRHDYLLKVQDAINRLNYWERAVIINKYCNDDSVFDYQVYADLHMSERKYYRLKNSAIYKLAFALHLEVYREDEAQ